MFLKSIALKHQAKPEPIFYISVGPPLVTNNIGTPLPRRRASQNDGNIY